MKQQISSDHAPKAIGPYSQAIHSGSMVLCSGQLGLDPQTGELVQGGVSAQTKQILMNLEAILKEVGCTLGDVIKTTVFLQHMDDFSAMNEVYSQMMPSPYPARSTVEVAKLPKGGLVEIECMARIKREESCCSGSSCACGKV